MQRASLSVIPLRTFLNKTLGGFAASTAEHWDSVVARLYPAGVKTTAIVSEAGITWPTLYSSLRRQGIPLRTA
jgi:hypothetical protein